MLSTLGGTLKKAFGARGSKGGRVKKPPPPPLPLAPPPERKVPCVIVALYCSRGVGAFQWSDERAALM